MTKSGKTLWQKEKLHVLCNFFFCHYVFKKPSAAEASESVYMRERVKHLQQANFEKVVTSAEIGHIEQFHLLLQCFLFFKILTLSFIENFHRFVYTSSKSPAAGLVYVGKG